jgi:hypothetical protein
VDKKLLKLPKDHVFDIEDIRLIATMLNRAIIVSKYNTKKKYVLPLYKLNKVTEEDVPLRVSHLYLENGAFSLIIAEPKNTTITCDLALVHL